MKVSLKIFREKLETVTRATEETKKSTKINVKVIGDLRREVEGSRQYLDKMESYHKKSVNIIKGKIKRIMI